MPSKAPYPDYAALGQQQAAAYKHAGVIAAGPSLKFGADLLVACSGALALVFAIKWIGAKLLAQRSYRF